MSFIFIILLLLWCASLSSRVSDLEAHTRSPAAGRAGAGTWLAGIVLAAVVGFFLFAMVTA